MVGAVLAGLTTGRDALSRYFDAPFELPEPHPVLDLASRSESDLRAFKHIHQASFLHLMNLSATQKMKLIGLVDAYLLAASALNASAIYLAARSLLEQNAFLHEVQMRLVRAASKAEADWRGGGTEFFGVVVRARFATSRSDYVELLASEGVPRDRLKPLNVTNCLKGLALDADHQDVLDRYAFLCDYVHHNLAGATTANAGSDVARSARHPSGGAFLFPKAGAITLYRYPLPEKGQRALRETCLGVRADVAAAVGWINALPESPFKPDHVERVTGSLLGMPTGAEAVAGAQRAPERNAPCFCGSGTKFKRCHGRRGFG